MEEITICKRNIYIVILILILNLQKNYFRISKSSFVHYIYIYACLFILLDMDKYILNIHSIYPKIHFSLYIKICVNNYYMLS